MQSPACAAKALAPATMKTSAESPAHLGPVHQHLQRDPLAPWWGCRKQWPQQQLLPLLQPACWADELDLCLSP